MSIRSKFTISFFKGSAILVPFVLGRSIRGVTFQKPELDPYNSCLATQDFHTLMRNHFKKLLVHHKKRFDKGF